MRLMSKIEQTLYENAGGGEAGEKAVMARREYLNGYKLFMNSQLKEVAKMKYLPRNEKDYVNHDTVEDYYD